MLVARHECELSLSTDVARIGFEERSLETLMANKRGGFFEAFIWRTARLLAPTMPELRGIGHDGVHLIPTFDDIVALVADESRRRGRSIGIIPELKNSTHHRSVGLDLERALIEATRHHVDLQQLPFGIQSFEVGNLKELRESIAGQFDNVFLVQLIGDSAQSPFDLRECAGSACTYADMLSPTGLARISDYADAIAVHRHCLLPLAPATGAPGAATPLLREAHAQGLAVQAWTLRPENCYLPPAYRCGTDPLARCEAGAIREAHAFIAAGVDALFFDDPGLGRRAVDSWAL